MPWLWLARNRSGGLDRSLGTLVKLRADISEELHRQRQNVVVRGWHRLVEKIVAGGADLALRAMDGSAADAQAVASSAPWAWIFRIAAAMCPMSPGAASSRFCVTATVVAHTSRLPFNSWKLSR